MSEGKHIRSARASYRRSLENSYNYDEKWPSNHAVFNERVAVLASFIACGVVLAVAFALSIWSPIGTPGEGQIFITDKSNTIYALINGRIYPTSSLTNAQLIVGQPSRAQKIAYQALNSFAKGPFMGILGAPGEFSPIMPPQDAFAICDRQIYHTDSTVSVESIAFTPLSFTEPFANNPAPIYGIHAGKLYYIAAGKKVLIPKNREILLALHLENETPIVLSTALFNQIPFAGNLKIPHIPGLGVTPAYSNYISGTVIKSNAQYYVVTSIGLAKIPLSLAEALRNANSYAHKQIPLVTPDVVAHAPQIVLPNLFPEQVIPVSHLPIICGMWNRNELGMENTYTNSYDHIPGKSNDLIPTVFNPAPAHWAQVNYVAFRNGITGFLVHISANSTLQGGIFYLSNTGICYGISADQETATALGLKFYRPLIAPWNIISVFPEGPFLSRHAALTIHNFMR